MQRRHAFQAGRRVFVVFEIIGEQLGHPDAGLQGPVGIRVDAQGMGRESALQGLETVRLDIRIERSGLELDAAESVRGHHPARFGHELLLRQHLAPGVGRIRRIEVPAELEEQVGTERDLAPNRAAQQLPQWRIQVTRLQIHARDFERREHLGDGLVAFRGRRHIERHVRSDRAAQRGDALEDAVQVERAHSDQCVLDLLQRQQSRTVAVSLSQADQPGVALDLDDRSKRKRLVYAARVE